MRVTRASDIGNCWDLFGTVARWLSRLAALCSSGLAIANISNGLDLSIGVTDLSEDMYALHGAVLAWIATGRSGVLQSNDLDAAKEIVT